MAGSFGYTGKILRVDLSSGEIADVPTLNYADRFIGGRGIAAKIYWDEVPPEVSALDPENKLIFITGPLGGVPGLAGSRWEICGKSSATMPEHFSYCNLGGSWGAYLKFAGYDGIIIQGKSEKPVYLLLQDGTAKLRDASKLWGRSSIEVQSLLKSELGNEVRVVSTGPAGDNMASIATVLADEDSSGGGFGAVMGSKKLKAVAVKGSGSRPKVAHPEKLSELTKYLREAQQGRGMFLLRLPNWPQTDEGIRQQVCYGCIIGCYRVSYKASDGEEGKFFCQSSEFYKKPALDYYGARNEVPFHVNRLCNQYGLDTKALANIIEWLSRCHKADILTDDDIGIPISKLGSIEFIETLVKKISLREDFGDTLAQGIHRAADSLGDKAKEILSNYLYKTSQTSGYYDGRTYITTGLFYAMEPREPIAQLHTVCRLARRWKNWADGLKGAYLSSDVIHAIAQRFWGSQLAADFSTYEGKALAAKKIQDREYVIACLVLCGNSYPNTDVPYSEDHVGDSAIESKVYSAVTGNEVGEEELDGIGERVFNLQRAILVREGHQGREDDHPAEFNFTVPTVADFTNPDCIVPGKDGELISRKGAVIDREKYEEMLDEYYQLRGWDIPSGLQTKAKLEELHLGDISRQLEQRGLTT